MYRREDLKTISLNENVYLELFSNLGPSTLYYRRDDNGKWDVTLKILF